MRRRGHGARTAWLVVGLVIVGAGCSMRVSGVVRDAANGTPIGGAVLTADDGRQRLTVTDPAGRFAVKTDWHNTTLTVSAPGYQTVTLPVGDDDRFPTVTVDLQRAFAAASPTAAMPEHVDSTARPVPVAGGSDAGTEQRLLDLQSLYERGLISNDEYKRTRGRIVDGM
jgi:hypothetical protein